MNPADILEARRAQLARLHPLKQEHRERARELQDEQRGLKEQAETRAEEYQITQGHPLDLFPTPPDLAAHMVELANPHGVILEPSAGAGRILDAIKAAGYAPIFCELNYNAAELLRRRGYIGVCGDFLEYTHTPPVDTVIMNPPFSNGADVDHVLHAFEILRESGRIVAIMSEHAFFASDKKSSDFREWIDSRGYSEPLDAGTFRASGTMVSARLVIIDKERR